MPQHADEMHVVCRDGLWVITPYSWTQDEYGDPILVGGNTYATNADEDLLEAARTLLGDPKTCSRKTN